MVLIVYFWGVIYNRNLAQNYKSDLVFAPKYRELNWDSRAVLSTDKDDVNLIENLYWNI